jgi:hypothetical protein
MAKKATREPSPSAMNDQWTRRAIAAAIAEAREAIGHDKAVFPDVRIGHLRDTEWGWIAAGILFGWIQTRAQQATLEGWDLEHTIRTLGTDPEPWSTGAIEAVLPKLFEACPDLSWDQPIAHWSRDAMTEFLATALALIRRAEIARDVAEARVAGREIRADVIARQANAAAGGPRMTPREFDDSIPPF